MTALPVELLAVHVHELPHASTTIYALRSIERTCASEPQGGASTSNPAGRKRRIDSNVALSMQRQ